MAKPYNLRIDQGETWQLTIPVTLPDGGTILGYTAVGQVREFLTDAAVLYEWSDEQGNLAIADDGSAVIIDVTAATSSGWLWRRGVWALELTDPLTGVTARLLEGWVYVTPETVRPA